MLVGTVALCPLGCGDIEFTTEARQSAGRSGAGSGGQGDETDVFLGSGGGVSTSSNSDDVLVIADGEAGSMTANGGTQAGQGGTPHEPKTGGGAWASGGGELPPLAEGTRVGPSLSEIDVTMGGYNTDLPEPEPCPDLPSSTCVTFSGLINDEAISGRCEAADHLQPQGLFTCSGDGFSFSLTDSGYMGSPPHQFSFVASPREYVLGFSWDYPEFESHQEGVYAIEATHEQHSMRAFGVSYEIVHDDDSSTKFVSAAWGVRWLSRITCDSCPSVRLVGRFSSPVMN